jgi:hypothetical protein
VPSTIAEGRFDRTVAWQNRSIVDVPLATAIERPQQVDPDGILVRTAGGLGISLGDARGQPYLTVDLYQRPNRRKRVASFTSMSRRRYHVGTKLRPMVS